MPYITREDGERLVIPSYRDVLTAKSKSTLKKEILLLSQNYGEYITLQRKNITQYEVAFSPDTGYLLGESVWHYFKKPQDMIYCEAIPNTSEAILVIVKSGGVYLDGSFPLDSISEELVIFLTQQNNFQIYTYGDVPIAQIPEEGKFSFDASSVKSFTVLEDPIFATLPLLRIYQLQLVDPVLKSHGIGVFPIRPVLITIVSFIFLWMGWSYLSQKKEIVPAFIAPTNPYEAYNTALMSPAPDQAIESFVNKIELLFGIPGWMPIKVDYENGVFIALMQSTGSKTEQLFNWAKENNMSINIKSDGIYLSIPLTVPNRPTPTRIYSIKEVIGKLVDNLSDVYPGNNIELGSFISKGPFTTVMVTIKVAGVSPTIVALIGKQIMDLPYGLQRMTFNVSNGSLTGSIILDALGD